MKFIILFICFSALPLWAFENPPLPTKPSYILKLVNEQWPDRPFLVEIPSTNIRAIRSLENYIAGGIQYDKYGDVEIGIVSGRILQTEPTPEHPWHFMLAPDSIGFSDVTTEVCDGTFGDVEANLTYWITIVKRYCPWNTRHLVKGIYKTVTTISEVK
jgi:hypothetical protein